MNERIAEIRFTHFRGIPEKTFKLSGKNYVIFGGTGRGKSSIVDGVEFFFKGFISRFRGEGTGHIQESEAVSHVNYAGEGTTISVCFTPSNEVLSREYGTAFSPETTNKNVLAFVDAHSAISFILRRGQLLEFINDQDASRYQKYLDLLGLRNIDEMQKAFIDAERISKERSERVKNELEELYSRFQTEEQSAPGNMEELLGMLSSSVVTLGLEPLAQFDELDGYIGRLDEKRCPETKDKVDLLNKTITCLESPIPEGVSEEFEKLNSILKEIRQLRMTLPEADKIDVINAGLNYLRKHETDECPLCEQKFKDPYDKVIHILEERQNLLSRLNELNQERRVQFRIVISKLSNLITMLDSEAEDYELYEEELKNKLIAIRKNVGIQIKKIELAEEDDECEVIEWTIETDGISSLRSEGLTNLIEIRDKLISPDLLKLEDTARLLRKAKNILPEIQRKEIDLRNCLKVFEKSHFIKESFSKAREKAVQKVFDGIADKVLDYYNFLHAVEGTGECSECSKVKLKASQRAQAGGFNPAIDFFKNNTSDPKAFRSEGHLDSLGLCIYLATVKFFNPPGTLLVLDDVLTSIDSEHRHRVRDLLLGDFSKYQIVLTTHDEYWFEQIRNAVIARGESNKWRFERIARWSFECGPESSNFEESWDYIEANLDEDKYCYLGSTLRLVFEDFMKRFAEKNEFEVKYKRDGHYTAGDFIAAGIVKSIREKLLASANTGEEQDIVKQILSRTFGNEALINHICHDSAKRLEVTLSEVRDFVSGLKDLCRKCEDLKLLKGTEG